MTNPPPSSVTLNPTRQQLDELDALMKRMLALPAEEPDESPRVEFPDESETPAHTNSHPVLVHLAAAAAELPAPQDPSSHAPQPFRLLLTPAPALLRKDQLTEVMGVARPGAAHESERFVADELEPSTPTGATDREPFPWACYPLLWINRTFDGFTGLLGPPGRWVRKPGGRALMGGLGLLLLAAAVARSVLDWMGWTW